MTAPPSALSAEDLRHLRLLEYLASQGGRTHDLAKYYDGDDTPASEAVADVRHLQSVGALEVSRNFCRIEDMHRIDDMQDIVDGVSAKLQRSGLQFLEKMRCARLGRSQRQWALRHGLLVWLYEQEAVGSSQSITWDGFDADLRSLYYGEPFRSRERDAAAAWLQRQGLIDGDNVAEAGGPVRAFITDQGERCAEMFDCDVKAYIESKERSSVGNTVWNVTGEQVQIATGDKSQQTISLGATAEQIKLGLQGVAELLAGLQLDPGTKERAAALAAAAIEDLNSDEPTGEAAKRFLEWVKDSVQKGGTAAVVAAVTAMSSGILEDIERLVITVGGA